MKYYDILYANGKIQGVERWEGGDFNVLAFWDGLPFEGVIPKEVQLFIPPEDEGLLKPAILPNPVSWLIISDRLLEIWSPYIEEDVQVFDAPIFYELDHRPCQGYRIINPIRVVDCINWDKTVEKKRPDGTRRAIYNLTLRKDRLGKHHIFRLEDYLTPLIISPKLVKCLTDDIHGVAFLKIPVSE